VKIKTKILGNFILTLGRLINPEINNILPFINQPLKIDSTSFFRDFGINPSEIRITIKEMAHEIQRLIKEKNK